MKSLAVRTLLALVLLGAGFTSAHANDDNLNQSSGREEKVIPTVKVFALSSEQAVLLKLEREKQKAELEKLKAEHERVIAAILQPRS